MCALGPGFWNECRLSLGCRRNMRANRITLNANQITAMPNDESSFSLTCHEEEATPLRDVNNMISSIGYNLTLMFHLKRHHSSCIFLIRFPCKYTRTHIIFQLGKPPKNEGDNTWILFLSANFAQLLSIDELFFPLAIASFVTNKNEVHPKLKTHAVDWELG